jgi:hypothetical protein
MPIRTGSKIPTLYRFPKMFLLLAAIDAVAGIRPQEAPGLLRDLTDDDDDDIAEAAFEAIAMAEGLLHDDDDEEDDAGFLC